MRVRKAGLCSRIEVENRGGGRRSAKISLASIKIRELESIHAANIRRNGQLIIQAVAAALLVECSRTGGAHVDQGPALLSVDSQY